MRIINETKRIELASDARVARSYVSRLIGLLGKSSLKPGEALVIEPCSSVHTAFMRFAIDVLYVDRDRRVVKAAPRLRPFRISGVLRGGHAVIELPAGVLDATATAAGDQLRFEA